MEDDSPVYTMDYVCWGPAQVHVVALNYADTTAPVTADCRTWILSLKGPTAIRNLRVANQERKAAARDNQRHFFSDNQKATKAFLPPTGVRTAQYHASVAPGVQDGGALW